MSRLTSLALMPWMYLDRSVPYTQVIDCEDYDFNLRGQTRTVSVRPVTVKTGFAASRRTMSPHAVAEAAAVVVDGKVTYATRWLCVPRQGSTDAVLLSPDAPDGLCRMCAAKAEGDGPGVYRIFDAAGALLYVGSSVHVHERVMHHRLRAKWNSRIADVTVTRTATIAQARAAEFAAIRTEHPLLNVMHAQAGAA